MNPQKVLLYYGFTPINDPVAVQLWQKNLCETLNLKGRILISPTGINGTVGGDIDDHRDLRWIGTRPAHQYGVLCPRSHVVSRNKLANVHNQIIPNFIGFLDHLRITFIPCELHSFIDNLERVHRGDVVKLFNESGLVRHRDLVAGDRPAVNS